MALDDLLESALAATKEPEQATVSNAEDSSSDDLEEIGGSLLTQALGMFTGPVSKPGPKAAPRRGPKAAPRSAQVQPSGSGAAARSSQSTRFSRTEFATGTAAGADAAVRVASVKADAARAPIAAGAGEAVQANAVPAPIIAAGAGAAVRAASAQEGADGEEAATRKKGRPTLAFTKAAVALKDQVDRDIERIEDLRANFALDIQGDVSAKSDRHYKAELNKKANEVAQILAACAKASKKLGKLPAEGEDQGHALIHKTVPLMEAANRIIKVAQIHTHGAAVRAIYILTCLSIHTHIYMSICLYAHGAAERAVPHISDILRYGYTYM